MFIPSVFLILILILCLQVGSIFNLKLKTTFIQYIKIGAIKQ